MKWLMMRLPHMLRIFNMVLLAHIMRNSLTFPTFMHVIPFKPFSILESFLRTPVPKLPTFLGLRIEITLLPVELKKSQNKPNIK